MEVDMKSPIGLPNMAPLLIGSAANLESYIFFKLESIEIIHNISLYQGTQNLGNVYLKNIPHIHIFLS